MFGSQHHERSAPERVRAGRKDDEVAGFGAKDDFGTFAFADPIALHGFDLLGPFGQFVDILEQTFGVVGDFEKPLLELALFDLGTTAPTAPFGVDLLIGQHGLVDGVPVHQRFGAVRQTTLVEELEQPLRPAVVVGRTGSELARPVIHDAGNCE